ncbi:NADH dehydrogenase [ubiquinone] 1 beta subcomplex subunit 10 [Heteronotia binoei]|uniref:NADH dehydrogenase [ubiquinone] 1 beta subcomplex subunit 10 n=1 Tax=Heteronotia binoei TaxID=13085 RepID=UPI00293109E5|nr:NADH dehydrogenase [ubiquinone] 1 beta subcomplex subunit 10 [Heteronotia binoei]
MPPEPPDRDVYREPPRRTPAANPQSAIPNPIDLIEKIFTYTVDAPVTAWRNFMERQHAKRKFYYYHREFRRVPDLTECLEDDYVCFFEAEMQWDRDKKVDEEIVKIVQERLGACTMQEGSSHIQKCAREMQQLKDVTKAYQTKYGDIGYHGNARTCLMKQKHRMIAERKVQAAAQADH